MGRGYFGLSVATYRGKTGDQIASKNLPHDFYSECEASALLDKELDLRMDDETNPGHACVFFAADPSDDELQAVIDSFGPPKENPNPGPTGRW